MTAELWLRIAYAANIAILAPVVLGLLFARREPVLVALGGRIQESEGLRLLVASLWGAILILSAAGLAAPRLFWTVLLFQIVYKTAWLAGYVLPIWRREGARAVPWGPAICFAIIVAVWPFILAAAWRAGVIVGL